MTPTISPVAGALPQQPVAQPTTAASGCSTAPTPLTPTSSVGVAPDTTASALAGGATQAVQGAAIASPEQLIPVLQQLVTVVNQLVAVLQQRGGSVAGATGGGAATGQVGACGMTGCSMDHAAEPVGAFGAPTAAAPARTGKRTKQRSGGQGAPGQSGAPANAPAAAPPANPRSAATVEPSSVRDKTSLAGLNDASKRGLEEAHKFGLPLVSGKRSGGGSSDHDHGNAIDVADIPIGVASSDGGSPKMKSFAEHMRQEGKAGRLDVKYIIRDGQIASATNDWEWRDYIYPGKSESSLAALKASNPGEYNRLQHYDHVHVSFK